MMKRFLIDTLIFSYLMMAFAHGGTYIRDWAIRYFPAFMGLVIGVPILAIFFLLKLSKRKSNNWQRPELSRLLFKILISFTVIFGLSYALHLPFGGQAVVEWIHWGLFALLGAVWTYRRRFEYYGFLTLAGGIFFPILDECIQAIHPQRVGDPRDVVLDCIAWCLGSWILHSFLAPHRPALPLSYATVIAAWTLTGLMILTGYDWLIGPYDHRIQFHTIEARWNSRLPEPGLPPQAHNLKGIESWVQLTLGHEKQRWLARMKEIPVCTERAGSIFEQWAGGTISQTPLSAPAETRCYERNPWRWAWLTGLATWWFIIPLYLFLTYLNRGPYP